MNCYIYDINIAFIFPSATNFIYVSTIPVYSVLFNILCIMEALILSKYFKSCKIFLQTVLLDSLWNNNTSDITFW